MQSFNKKTNPDLNTHLINFQKIVTTIVLIFIVQTSVAQLKESLNLSLNSGWQFREANTERWMNATVPGCVHTDLVSNGVIEDVFNGSNEKNVQWIETKDWEYRSTFNIDEKLMAKENIDLVMEGLDTYADVFINETKVLEADNMFTGYTIPVKQFITNGQNTIRIYFHSAVNYVMPLFQASDVKYPADNDGAENKTSPYTRKAAYQFGWDIAPRMVGCGIWRSLKLEAWNGVKITDVYLRPIKITSKRAKYEAEVSLEATYSGPLQFIIRDYEDGELTAKKLIVNADNRKMKIKIPVSIKNPELWWPNGSGTQTLYDLDFEVVAGNDLYKTTKQIGVRTIEVINKADKDGKSFFVKVNELPTYMKGANYVPMDIFPSRVTPEQYSKLFADLKKSNFNMLRVWGGGIYESDEFYRLADENGILIWQDFMFSGTMYPVDSAFTERVRSEARYNIVRLHNHPSLALWCGNNEIQVAWDNWGWQKTYNITAAQATKMYDGYKKIFNEILPSEVEKSDSGMFYFASSPQSNWGNAAGLKSGDNHYWGVWHGEEPVESYQTNVPRFASEFGLPSLPEMNSIARFTTADDRNINSELMHNRMKSYKGLGLLEKYVDANYNAANDFEDFVYKTNVLQADAVTSAIEAQRISKPFCMGSLYWQLTDCWPGITWSSIDYYGKWKALQYRVKDAFEAVMITPQMEKNKVKLWIVDDKNIGFNATLDLRLINFTGKVLWNKDYKLKIKANESYALTIDSLFEELNEDGRKNVALECILFDSKGVISQRNLFFEKTKQLDLPAVEFEKDVCQYGKGYMLTLQSKTVAKNVCLTVVNGDADFSDNYFDMMPGEVRQVEITSPLSIEQVVANLKIRTMRKE
ncbi:MAG: glycoside hydrolase family 2 protein [Bacteroidia bacterium]